MRVLSECLRGSTYCSQCNARFTAGERQRADHCASTACSVFTRNDLRELCAASQRLSTGSELRALLQSATAFAASPPEPDCLPRARPPESTSRRFALRREDALRKSPAPPGSWGRPLAALRCRLLAGNRDVAVDDAERVLMEGAAEAESPIGRYAAALALLTLGRDGEAALHAEGLIGREDFPDDVASALVALADADAPAYDRAVRSVLRSFETRDRYLEDVPVADTVLVLQALAVERGVDATLESQLLPGQVPLPRLGTDPAGSVPERLSGQTPAVSVPRLQLDHRAEEGRPVAAIVASPAASAALSSSSVDVTTDRAPKCLRRAVPNPGYARRSRAAPSVTLAARGSAHAGPRASLIFSTATVSFGSSPPFEFATWSATPRTSSR